MQVQQEEAIVVRVLVSRGTEMNKTVPVLVEQVSGEDRHVNKQLRGRLGRMSSVVKWGSHPQIFGTQQTLGN